MENLICSTGYFKERGELIRHYRPIISDPVRFIRGYSRHYYKENFIFHAKIYQLKDRGFLMMKPKDFLTAMEKEGWKIIFIYRNNLLRQAVSKQIAIQRNIYHHKKDVILNKPFKIDTEMLENEILLRQQFYKDETDDLKDLPHLEINYEDDLLDSSLHQKTINRVLDFIGLPRREASTLLQRTSKKGLSDLISNYEEVVDVLDKNGWSYFIEDKAYA